MEELKKLVRSKAVGTNKDGVMHINYDENDIFDLVKEVYNMALDKAAENAKVYHAKSEWEDTGYVDKHSILNLKIK